MPESGTFGSIGGGREDRHSTNTNRSSQSHGYGTGSREGVAPTPSCNSTDNETGTSLIVQFVSSVIGTVVIASCLFFVIFTDGTIELRGREQHLVSSSSWFTEAITISQQLKGEYPPFPATVYSLRIPPPRSKMSMFELGGGAIEVPRFGYQIWPVWLNEGSLALMVYNTSQNWLGDDFQLELVCGALYILVQLLAGELPSSSEHPQASPQSNPNITDVPESRVPIPQSWVSSDIHREGQQCETTPLLVPSRH